MCSCTRADDAPTNSGTRVKAGVPPPSLSGLGFSSKVFYFNHFSIMCVPSHVRVPTCTYSKQKRCVLSHLALFPEGVGSVKYWEARGALPLSSPCQQQKMEPCSPFWEATVGCPSSFCIHFILTKLEAGKKLWVNLQSRERKGWRVSSAGTIIAGDTDPASWL